MTDTRQHDAMPMSLEAHVAVQTVELRHIKETVERIEAAQGGHVTTTQWEQRNGYVDGKFEQVHVEIQAVKADLAAQRAPWWVILGAGLGIISAVVALMSVLAK